MGRASRGKRPPAGAPGKPAAAAPVVGLVPRSVEALGPAQVRAVQEIQAVELRRRDVERQLDALVVEGRRAGISWAALGWALGISSQAAQQRYGKRL
jgi:hypothetical protein